MRTVSVAKLSKVVKALNAQLDVTATVSQGMVRVDLHSTDYDRFVSQYRRINRIAESFGVDLSEVVTIENGIMVSNPYTLAV